MKNCPQCRSGPTTRTLAKLRKTGARLNGAKAEAVGAQRAIGGQRTCRKRRRRVDPSSGNNDGIAPSMIRRRFRGGAETHRRRASKASDPDRSLPTILTVLERW
jgi:hypothetical protein